MVVEPESLCWLTGRLVGARDGVTWAEEFARFPALEAVVRDDGSGVGTGGNVKEGVPCGRPGARLGVPWSVPTGPEGVPSAWSSGTIVPGSWCAFEPALA